jgi:nitrogen regulatory protein P-II 1
MKKIEAYIQPFMLRKVEEALRAIHIHGMTVIDARGFGKEKDGQYPHNAAEYAMEFTRKDKIEIVCPDAQCEQITKTIQHAASTGRRGDGKIIVSSIEDAISIRTGEEGENAI